MEQLNLEMVLVFLVVWVFSSPSLLLSLSAPIDVRPDPPLSSVSDPLLPTEKEPSPQFSSGMDSLSPGVQEVEVVHHLDLNKKILIALIVSSTLLVGILLFSSCFWVYRRKMLEDSTEKGKASLDASKGLSLAPFWGKFNSLKLAGKKGSVALIEYPLLEAATSNFRDDNILGEGGSGNVYKARFNNNFQAAVKKFHGGGQHAERVFENEVDWLSKIQHQSIVSLLCCCIHGNTRFLVYEIMHNGSLESQLHGPSHGSALTWNRRMKIALDIAKGLEYLHERHSPPVIHRDLKSSNILLDSNFNAKLSDFGLAVTVGTQNKNSIKLSGNLGYIAPEYLLDVIKKLLS